MAHQEHTSEQGFSLIDLMIATMISLVLIGAVLSVVIQQGSERRSTAEGSLALSAALNNIERIRTIPQADVPALDGVGFDVPGPNGAPGGLRPLAGDPDGLPGRFSVTEEPPMAGARLFLVVATVDWRGVSGRRHLGLRALIGERK